MWPDRIRSEVIAAVQAAGIEHPWAHQARAAEHALDGESVVVATGTASGKSLAYLVPALSALLDGSEAPMGVARRPCTSPRRRPWQRISAAL